MGRFLPNGNEVRIHALGGTLEASWVAYGAGQWGTPVAAGNFDAFPAALGVVLGMDTFGY